MLLREEKMFVIILGCGRQGARLALLLEQENHKITIIDNNIQAFKRLENFQGNRLLGNGIDIDVLRQAGIERADAFAAVTNGDNTNLMAAQVAQKIFKVPKVVCRVYDPRRASIYYDLGLQTVCSTTVGARMLRNVIVNPTVLRTYQIGEGTVQAIEIKISAPAAGKKISDINMPGEIVVSAIIREGKPMVAKADDIICANDQLFVTVAEHQIQDLKKMCGVTSHAVNYIGEERGSVCSSL